MASKAIETGDRRDVTFADVGTFLAGQRLPPAPAFYALGWEVLRNADGEIARAVAALTRDGVRLPQDRARALAREAVALSTDDADGYVADAPTAPAASDGLVERALSQVAGFAETVQVMLENAGHLGRDLQASAEAIRIVGPEAGIAEVTRLTAAMVERLHRAERRLERARAETDALRHALDEAHGVARIDALTGIANRRAFDETFDALAPERRLVLALCDLDRFKAVNDRFGHDVGDRVLRVVAQTLAASGATLTARYGGEEFALLFEDADASTVAGVLDATRAALAARRLRVRETGEMIGTLTFSSGIAAGVAGEGREPLLRRTDAALYLAKNAGRSQTVVAPENGADRLNEMVISAT